MARIRTLKPEFFQDESLASCSPHARLLAIALLQLCDRQGVFRNIPMQVHAHAFPWEAMVKVPALLGELEAVGYLSFYSVDGKGYGFVPGFTKHQSIGGKEAQTPGRYPLPDQADTCEEVTGKSQGSDEVLPREAKGTAGKGKGKGTRKGKEGEAVASRLPPDWEPSEANLEYCRKTRTDLNPETVAENFRDYWVAKPGALAKKLDWNRTWNKWVRGEKQNVQATNGTSGKPVFEQPHERRARELDEALARAEGAASLEADAGDLRGQVLEGVWSRTE